MSIRDISLYQKVFDSAIVAIGVTDLEGKFVSVNETWCRLLGYTHSEAATLTIRDISTENDILTSVENYSKILRGDIDNYSRVRMYKRKNGSTFWANLHVSALRDDTGKISGVLGIFIDIEQQVVAEEQLKATNAALAKANEMLLSANAEISHSVQELQAVNQKLDELSKTDTLTGLLNRREMETILDYEARRTDRSRREFAIVIGDIDDFKKINDSYGHAIGDKVLQEVARVLSGLIRSTDFVGRWGGEEFMLILTDVEYLQADTVMIRIIQAFNSMIMSFNNHSLSVTMTLGYDYYRANDDLETVIKKADIAMYEGKRRGKNTFVFFDEKEDCFQPDRLQNY